MLKPHIYSVLLFIIATIMVACSNSSTISTPAPPTVAAVDSPFPTGEPEKYQTEIWQTTSNGVEKFLVARAGTKWRVDSAYGDPAQVTTLHTDKDYVIAVAQKTYAEYPTSHGYDERDNMVAEISYNMLNNKLKGVYEKDGNTYKIMNEGDKPGEAVVTFDDKLQLPTKKEIYRTVDGKKSLVVTVTLNNFKTEPDASLFDIPKDFKKVAVEDMKRVLTGASSTAPAQPSH